MKRKLLFTIQFLFVCIFTCTVLACTKRQAVNTVKIEIKKNAILDETSIEGFVSNYAQIQEALQKNNITRYRLESNDPASVLEGISQIKLSSELKKAFEEYGLNSETGHIQLAVIQYGIIASTIEDALAEVASTERNASQEISDEGFTKYINTIKNLINSDDYALVRKHKAELTTAFNKFQDAEDESYKIDININLIDSTKQSLEIQKQSLEMVLENLKTVQESVRGTSQKDIEKIQKQLEELQKQLDKLKE